MQVFQFLKIFLPYVLGRGGKGGGRHSLHEWFLNENGAEAIKLALLIMFSEAGLAR